MDEMTKSNATQVDERLDIEQIATNELNRSKKSLLNDYEITIIFINGRGCIVQVGCKQIAFEDPNQAMKEINEYVLDPIAAYKKWIKIFQN
jgi:hypothetical protein